MESLFFSAASGIANALVACTLKGAENSKCRIAAFGFTSMVIAASLAFAFIPMLPGTYSDSGPWISGISAGILMSIAIATSVLANKEGPPSLVWSMANLGLIVPIVLAAAFQNERLRITDILLLGNFVLMLWMFKRGMNTAKDFPEGSSPWRYIILLIAVFLSNGLLMFGFKFNETICPHANKACFVAALYAGAAMLFLLSGICNGLRHLRKNELKWGLLMGTATVTAVLMLQMAMKLPAIVVFPLTQGIALIGGIILMALIYKERINKFKLAGMALGLTIIVQSIIR